MAFPNVQDAFSRAGRYLKSLFTNRFFWIALGSLVGILAVFYVLFNHVLMPSVTRHDAAVEVPDVVEQPFEEAVRILEARGLQPERVEQRFRRDVPRDVVVDQNPQAQALVKPGRHVYLTVNSGSVRMVKIPPVEGMSLREAMNRLRAIGLQVAETRPDSMPSPYPNTVTRQEPSPGDSLSEGSRVTLWYSTGLGEQYTTVPEVTGLSVEEARQLLLDASLRAVVIGTAAEEDEEAGLIVTRQSREPGTRVREGFEVRLFVGEEAPEAPEGPTPEEESGT